MVSPRLTCSSDPRDGSFSQNEWALEERGEPLETTRRIAGVESSRQFSFVLVKSDSPNPQLGKRWQGEGFLAANNQKISKNRLRR